MLLLCHRWTMTLVPKLVPWRPRLAITGRSLYCVEASTGRIAGRRDMWDAVKNNAFLSVGLPIDAPLCASWLERRWSHTLGMRPRTPCACFPADWCGIDRGAG